MFCIIIIVVGSFRTQRRRVKIKKNRICEDGKLVELAKNGIKLWFLVIEISSHFSSSDI
jgi:hypothetical protein